MKYFSGRKKDFLLNMQIEYLNIFMITELLTPDENFET